MRGTSLKGLAGILLVVIVACGDDAPNGIGGPTAQLKVVHAAAALGAVDVRIGGASVISGLSYGHSSAITAVPAGSQRLIFRSGASDVAQVDVTLSTTGINAVAFNGDTAQVTPVTPDTGQAATNRANVRMINVAGTNASPPTLLSVLVNYPGVSPDSVAVFGLNATVPSHGSLMYFDPGHFRFRFVPQGTTSVLTEVEFDVIAGEKKAVVLERSAAGAYSARVVTEP
ncbi:MAG: DUF4397 domain-containing protein [Gemmatimonadaceae bacterium]